MAEQKEGRHARIYASFFKLLPVLSRSEINTYLVLRIHADSDGLCLVKRSTIAKMAGCSERQADRAIRLLKRRGLIPFRKRKGNAWYFQTI